MQSQDSKVESTTGSRQRGSRSAGRPVIVGEVLFDEFPDGSRVLGGAPFNVAWHLQAFGHRPLMITRIGSDEAGAEVRDSMSRWGLDLEGVQVDPQRPTGTVCVDLDSGQPSYTILADQAYDVIERVPAVVSARAADGRLLYHGTLAARTDISRQAILELREIPGISVFVDVNLRDPWWLEDKMTQLLEGVAWLKLNEDELRRLLPGDGGDGAEDVTAAAERLRRRVAASEVLVTRGELGAAFVSDGDAIELAPPPPRRMVDTVGAGDAFSAVWIAGELRGWTAETKLRRSLDFASRICTIRGATTTDKEVYDDVLDDWAHVES